MTNTRHFTKTTYIINKLGNELFEYLSDKDLSVMNTAQPTRKDKIIDLTIVSNAVAGKVSNWKVQQEVYLNTDHNLVSFEYGESDAEGTWERLDFKNTDWTRWESLCKEQIDEWLGMRRIGDEINEDYASFVDVLKQVAGECIPKKMFVNIVKDSVMQISLICQRRLRELGELLRSVVMKQMKDSYMRPWKVLRKKMLMLRITI